MWLANGGGAPAVVRTRSGLRETSPNTRDASQLQSRLNVFGPVFVARWTRRVLARSPSSAITSWIGGSTRSSGGKTCSSTAALTSTVRASSAIPEPAKSLASNSPLPNSWSSGGLAAATVRARRWPRTGMREPRPCSSKPPPPWPRPMAIPRAVWSRGPGPQPSECGTRRSAWFEGP